MATLAVLPVSTLPATQECPRRHLLSGLSGRRDPRRRGPGRVTRPNGQATLRNPPAEPSPHRFSVAPDPDAGFLSSMWVMAGLPCRDRWRVPDLAPLRHPVVVRHGSCSGGSPRPRSGGGDCGHRIRCPQSRLGVRGPRVVSAVRGSAPIPTAGATSPSGHRNCSPVLLRVWMVTGRARPTGGVRPRTGRAGQRSRREGLDRRPPRTDTSCRALHPTDQTPSPSTSSTTAPMSFTRSTPRFASVRFHRQLRISGDANRPPTIRSQDVNCSPVKWRSRPTPAESPCVLPHERHPPVATRRCGTAVGATVSIADTTAVSDTATQRVSASSARSPKTLIPLPFLRPCAEPAPFARAGPSWQVHSGPSSADQCVVV